MKAGMLWIAVCGLIALVCIVGVQGLSLNMSHSFSDIESSLDREVRRWQAREWALETAVSLRLRGANACPRSEEKKISDQGFVQSCRSFWIDDIPSLVLSTRSQEREVRYWIARPSSRTPHCRLLVAPRSNPKGEAIWLSILPNVEASEMELQGSFPDQPWHRDEREGTHSLTGKMRARSGATVFCEARYEVLSAMDPCRATIDFHAEYGYSIHCRGEIHRNCRIECTPAQGCGGCHPGLPTCPPSVAVGKSCLDFCRTCSDNK